MTFSFCVTGVVLLELFNSSRQSHLRLSIYIPAITEDTHYVSASKQHKQSYYD